MRWKRSATIVAIVAAVVAPTFFPELLAFPHHRRWHGSDVWSETPIASDQLDKVLGRTAALIASSPLAQANEPRRIFLTQGGWRWTWLAMRNRGAFAISRPARETIVLNRSDPAADRIWNGASLGGSRTLSGAIAHETCHGIERRHFGIKIEWSKPAWLREGYCDYVARESSLTQADVLSLRIKGQTHPALIYFEGRKRIEAELARNGGDVDALFASYGE